MNDERGTVFGKDVFKEPVKKNGRIHFPQRFTIVPGRRVDETVIGPLISPVKEVVSEAVLQVTQCFDTLQDVCDRDPFAEIVEQWIAE